VDYSNLAKVLERAVTDKGKFDQKKLEKVSESLDAQLKILSVTGPTVTPQLFASDEDTLAYWFNARAAWALKIASQAGEAKHLSSIQLSKPFPLDGREMTLVDIDAVLSLNKDWRAIVTAPGICLNRAGLPKKTFSACHIEEEINEQLNGFLDDEDRFVIDVGRKRTLVPPILWQFRQELTDEHDKSYGTENASFPMVLLGLTSGSAHRRIQDATGYRYIEGRRSCKLAVAD